MKDLQILIPIKKLNNFLKKKRRVIIYASFFFFLSVLVGAAVFDIFLRYYVFDKKIKSFPFAIVEKSFPVLTAPINPDISAKAAIIMDSDSKTVLFSKNPNLIFSLASTTKIMTALVALENFKMTDVLTIQTEKVEGVNVGFKVGEKLLFKDVLYAMLLPSGNDAALAVAQNYPGGEKVFVEKMNEKARILKLNHTNFADSIGLVDSRDFTTPLELARLAYVAIENEIFKDIVATKTTEISDISGTNHYLLNNLNKLLGIDGVNGIKTGYTDEAGQVLVTSKLHIDEKGNERILIIVVMDSLDRFWDTSKILYSLSESLSYLSIHPGQQIYKQ